MIVHIKRFDSSVPLPEYKTPGAAALDLAARIEVKIPAREVRMVPLNIALQLPKHHWVLMAARSSLFKKGLMLANGIGIGDEDYCGNNDEYHAALFNFTDQEVTVAKGDRVTQLIIMQREQVEFKEVTELKSKDRGGFGSTGR